MRLRSGSIASLAGKDKSRSKENSKRRGNGRGKSEVEVQGNINRGRDKCNLQSKRRMGEERAVRVQKRREILEQEYMQSRSICWSKTSQTFYGTRRRIEGLS